MRRLISSERESKSLNQAVFIKSKVKVSRDNSGRITVSFPYNLYTHVLNRVGKGAFSPADRL